MSKNLVATGLWPFDNRFASFSPDSPQGRGYNIIARRDEGSDDGFSHQTFAAHVGIFGGEYAGSDPLFVG